MTVLRRLAIVAWRDHRKALRSCPSYQLLAGTVFLSAALFGFSYSCVFGLIEQRTSVNWPRTQARVTRSETYFSRMSLDHRLRLQYRFEVGGREYKGERRYAIPPLIRIVKSDARQFVRDHPAGSDVGIAYNPQNPARSLVSPGLEVETWAPVALWLSLLAYGSVCLWTELRRWASGVDGDSPS